MAGIQPSQHIVREDKHAGKFYKRSEVSLRNEITKQLKKVERSMPAVGTLKAMIAPHSAHLSSRMTAAFAYRNLMG